MRYEDASGSFQASGPNANDDSDTLSAGSRQAATGNLITGEGTQYGAAGADSAAGGHITSIAGKGGEDSSFAGGKLGVTGEHGSLSVDAEGNYNYVANKGAPENVRDRFIYTLADNQGNSDTAALVIELGKTPVVIKADAQQVVPGPDGVVTLPPGVELSDVMVVGRNLVINMPDGTQLIIVDGAIFVPQLVLDGVQVPATNVAALLIGQEPQPAAGELPPSSGGNFALPPPPLDPGVPLGDLIPPTVRDYIPPEPQEVFDTIEEDEPLIDFGNIDILIDDDTLPAGLAGGPGDGPDAVNVTGFLASTQNLGGNPPYTFSLQLTTAPDGFAVISGGPGVALLQQNGVTVRTISFNEATGQYEITQNAPILHPPGDNENDMVFVVTVTATDADGDTATGTITITYDDDTPDAVDDVDSVTEGGPIVADGNVFTGVGGSDANTTDGVADPQGADGAEMQGFSQGATAGTFGVPFAASHGTLVLNADGSYTYTLDGEDPAVRALGDGDTLTEIFNYTIIDADGDVSPATLTITINGTNEAPTIGNAAETVSEEGLLPNGIPDNVGVPSDDTNSATESGTMPVSDADGDPLTVTLGTPASGLTSNGVLVNWALSNGGHTLTGTAGGATIITITIDDAGNYNVVLSGQVDHPSAGVEDELSITIPVSVSDGSESSNATLTVTIEDDSPIVSEGQVTGTVDEDGVVEGIADGGEGDGIAGGVGDVPGTSTVASGSVAALFNPGADVPLSFGFAANAVATLQALGLTSNGAALTYQVVGDIITASTAAGDVFTFELNDNGDWEFTLIDQLDHAEGNDENDLTISLGNIIEATDADGDSVVGAADGLVITVDDDTPTVSEGQVTGTVDEDGVVEGTADAGEGDGIAGGTGDVPGTATVASGSVAAMFNSGADAPLSYSFAANAVATLEALNLTSNGVDLDYAIVGNIITASTAAGDVFTFELNDNGDWEFTLIDQLDHAEGNDENDLTINLGNIIQATDADGDSVVGAANGLVITVDDDTPVARNDEDTVPSGGDIITGNVITGANTDTGAAGADSTGADAPADVTGLASENVPANVDNDSAGGGFIVDGEFGQLTLQADGSYSYDRFGGSPGDVEDVFTYSYTDADGDTVTATLTIHINDSAPTLDAPPPALVDDDDVAGAGGNPGGTGDDAPANTSGSLAGLVTGGDGDIDFFFATTQPALPLGFTHNLVNSTTMQILQGVTVVLTITLNNETGAYSILQDNPVDHETLDALLGDNTENNLGPLNVGFVAIDENGTGDESNVVNLSITVDDDTPVATATQLTGTVDEDGVLEGAADAGPGDGIAGGTGDVGGAATVASGSVATLFSAGADQPLTFDFTANAIATLEALNLTSNGVDLDYAIVGDIITASTAAGDVFTFELNDNGDWEFTLIDQLDHANANAENDLTINLSGIIEATDFDGDSVVANANGLIITVDDDTPIATANQVTGTVDEDGVLEGADDDGPGDGIAGGTGDVTGEAVVASGSAVTMFQSGADAPLSYSFAANAVATLEALNLTSNGVDLDYAIVGDIITASTAAGDVFTFELNDNGDWEFTLIDQLDHANANAENDLTIALGAIIQATDADGDSVVGAANGLVITVDDDSPTLGTIEDGTASNNPADGTSSGELNFEVGADAPASVVSISANNTGITSGGFNLVTNVVDNVLTAYQDVNGNGTFEALTDVTAVYTLTVNPNAGTDGEWVFNLITAFDPTITDTPIGGSSSFGAGPTGFQILQGLDLADLSVVSGYLVDTVAAGGDGDGTFNAAAWLATGVLVSGDIASAGTNGSVSGWGVDNNNFENPNELFFFDFGSQATSDPDAGGPFVPPVQGPDVPGDPPEVQMPNISFATFEFINYTSGAGNAGDDIAYVVHYTDGSFDSGFVPDVNIDGALWTFTADAGKFIADIQFFSGMNPDGSVQDLPPGKIDLVSVGVQTSDLDETVDFTVTISDADGDQVSGSFSVNVADGNTPSQALLLSSSSQEEQLQKTAANSNTLTLATAVAAAGFVEPVAAHDNGNHNGHGQNSELSFAAAEVVERYSVSDDGGDAAVSMLAPDASTEASAPADSSSSSSSDNSSASNSLDDSAAQAAPESNDAPAADDGGANSSADAVGPVAPTVAMVSAEALEAAANDNGDAQQGGSVEQIVADALHQGDASDLDAVLANLPGGNGGLQAIAHLASPDVAAVSGWHMGGHGAIGAGFDMMFKMDVSMHHQDAVQPVANG